MICHWPRLLVGEADHRQRRGIADPQSSKIRSDGAECACAALRRNNATASIPTLSLLEEAAQPPRGWGQENCITALCDRPGIAAAVEQFLH